MKKIAIIGTSGCGKTTLGKKLTKLLNIENYDLDDYYWLANWQPREGSEFEMIVENITLQENWIISGNYSKVKNITLSRADCIIWLDYSFLTCLFRAFTRTIFRIATRQKCCGSNVESLTMLFSKYSIILWVIISYKRRKIEYSELFNNKESGKQYFRFKSPKQLERWLTANLKV